MKATWELGMVGLLVAGMASASGCGGATSAAVTAPELKVSALGVTPQAVADSLHVLITPGNGGYQVTLAAGPETPAGDVFVAVEYDATALHAVNLSPAGTPADGVLSLAVQSAPGTIEFGCVPAGGDASSAVETGDSLLSFTLKDGAADRCASMAENATEVRPRNLMLQQDYAGRWELSWDYTNPGDSMQDGEVSITDLSPLGAHFAEKLSGQWDDPLRNVDCDGNSEVGISDLTPIGAYYHNDVYAYKIQMSLNGTTDFITVGELLLGDQGATPGEAVRFAYTFGPQYVSGAWYRVQPQTHDLQFGMPSEAISEAGRLLELEPAHEDTTVVVSARDLPAPISQLNAVRLIYPAQYSYVKESFNVGSAGGNRADPDGLWGTFATQILFPPDSLLKEEDLGNGMKAMDFNVTVSESTLDAAPAGSGDLFNFILKAGPDAPALSLQTVLQTDEGIIRTYYTGEHDEPVEFGNSLVLNAY